MGGGPISINGAGQGAGAGNPRSDTVFCVAGVSRHQQTGGRQQRPQAKLAVQQVVRWSMALRWSFVQVRRLQRRRLVCRTDEPPLRLSAFLAACKRVGSRNPSPPISCHTAVSAAPLCACEIGLTTLETHVTRHGIVVSSQQHKSAKATKLSSSPLMGWRYEGTTPTAWTQPALDRSLILWVGPSPGADKAIGKSRLQPALFSLFPGP